MAAWQRRRRWCCFKLIFAKTKSYTQTKMISNVILNTLHRLNLEFHRCNKKEKQSEMRKTVLFRYNEKQTFDCLLSKHTQTHIHIYFSSVVYVCLFVRYIFRVFSNPLAFSNVPSRARTPQRKK